MKNLITKTLFVSLLFSAVAPAIANETAASEMYSVEGTAAEAILSGLSRMHSFKIHSVETPASGGIFSKFAAKVSGLKNGALSGLKIAGSYVAEKTQSVVTKASDLKDGAANLMAKYPKTTTGLRYGTYAAGITALGWVAYTAFNSEKAKKSLKKNSKHARRFSGPVALLAAVASYAGAVHKGYLLSPSDLLFTFSS